MVVLIAAINIPTAQAVQYQIVYVPVTVIVNGKPVVIRRPVVRPVASPAPNIPPVIANLKPGQWLELPNTKIRSVLPAVQQNGFADAIIIAWNGGTVDPIRNRLLVWGGGHNDYWGNEMYALDLPTLSIKRIIEPSPDTFKSNCDSALPDGTPTARHTYDGLTFITHSDRFFATSGSKAPCGFGTTDAWTYDFVGKQWQRKIENGPMQTPFGTMAVYDAQTKLVYIKDNVGFFSYNIDTNTFKQLNTEDQFVDYHLSGAIDSKRRKFVMLGDGVQLIDLNTYKMTRMTTSGTPGIATTKESPGVAYDPVADRVVAWHGGSQVWALNMDNGVWSQVANGPGPTSAAPYQGTFGRWAYIPNYHVYAMINDVDENAWVFRLTP
ncbi:MAG: hypothetical protein U1F34_09690 [Gammaproteobacteria bacterium]